MNDPQQAHGRPAGAPPDPDAVAYIAGQWGSPAALTVPLNDRGLLLADGLFETVLVEQGRPLLLPAHLARWHHSAALLGLATPPEAEQLQPLIAEAVQRSGIGTGALRLNWSRGSGSRGLDPPAVTETNSARFWLQLTRCQPRFDPLTAVISRSEQRLAGSVLSQCKTFSYGSAIQARREARSRGAEDALLPSSAGGLCCGTSANLLVHRQGRWLTPPLSSGCLPGTMRAAALAGGLAEEATLSLEALEGWWQQGDGACLLINSLSCRPVAALEGRPLPQRDGTPLWRELVGDGR